MKTQHIGNIGEGEINADWIKFVHSSRVKSDQEIFAELMSEYEERDDAMAGGVLKSAPMHGRRRRKRKVKQSA